MLPSRRRKRNQRYIISRGYFELELGTHHGNLLPKASLAGEKMRLDCVRIDPILECYSQCQDADGYVTE